MQSIMSIPRRRSLWLSVLSVAALTSLALTAPALERKTDLQVRQTKETVKQLPRNQKSFETSPMPVDWQLEQLRERIQQLEGQLAALQGQVQQHGAAGSNVAGRLAALEGAIQVQPSKLRLHSQGTVEIVAPGIITLNAGTKVAVSSGSVDMNSPHLRVHGTAQSEQVITGSVVSTSYTPGAGNVW